MRDFKDLVVWQRAYALSIDVYDALRRVRAPEHRSLKSQLGRAVDSIASNIVEGTGASSRREFARFLDISIKSTNEVEHHLLVARDRGALPRDACRALSEEVVEIRRMTFGLRKKLLIDDQSRP